MATLGEWTVILQFIVVMLYKFEVIDKSEKHFSWSMTLSDRRNDVKLLKTHARPPGYWFYSFTSFELSKGI